MALDFAISATDQVSGPATRAAAGMETAARQAKLLAGSLDAVEAALVKASAIGAKASQIAKLTNEQKLLSDALNNVAPGYRAEQAAAEQAAKAQAAKQAADIAATKTNAVLRASLSAATAGLKEFASALASGDAGGAIKGLSDSVAGAAKSLDLLAPGLGQAASAAIGFQGAILGATVGALQRMAEKALAATEEVTLLKTQLGALSGGAASGSEVLEVVEDIANRTGVARNEVALLARTFEGIGITNLGKLSTALLASRSATALVGASGGAAFEALTKKIQAASDAGLGLKLGEKGLKAIAETGVQASEVAARMGISVETLAANLKAGAVNAADFGDALQGALIDKGAGPLEAIGKSLSGIKARFSNAFDKLFEKVDAGPFLTQLSKLADMFDQSTASGQAMSLLVTETLDGLFSAAGRALPVVRELLIYTLISALEVMTFVEDHAETLGNAIQLTAELFKVLGVAALATATTLLKPFELAVEAYDLGGNIVSGLVNGILDGTTRVVDSAKSIATSALDTVKSTLGIHSPSAVMMALGANTAEGMAIGIDDGAGRVADASRTMARSPMIEAGSAAASSGGPQGGNMYTINVGGLHVSGAGKDAEQITEESVALVFDRMASMSGLGAAA